MAIAPWPHRAGTRYPRWRATEGDEEESSRGRAWPAGRFEGRSSSRQRSERGRTPANRSQGGTRALAETEALGGLRPAGAARRAQCLSAKAAPQLDRTPVAMPARWCHDPAPRSLRTRRFSPSIAIHPALAVPPRRSKPASMRQRRASADGSCLEGNASL